MNNSGTFTLTQNQHKDDMLHPVTLDFDPDASRAAIDRHLADALQSQNSGCIVRAVAGEPNKPAPQFAASAAAPQQADDTMNSDFLAELTREADQITNSRGQAIQDRHVRSQRLHEALAQIFKFLHALAAHVNRMEPQIGRIYSLDARTVYKDLACRNAFAEARKQDISDSALNDYVTFGLNLCTPHQVVCSRSWMHLEEMKRELQSLRIGILNDDDIDGKKAKQEWVQVRLAQNFPAHIKFQANYGKFCIEVSSRNLGAFGNANFLLDPEAVTQALLDDLGRFIIGRANKLPLALLPV